MTYDEFQTSEEKPEKKKKTTKRKRSPSPAPKVSVVFSAPLNAGFYIGFIFRFYVSFSYNRTGRVDYHGIKGTVSVSSSDPR